MKREEQSSVSTVEDVLVEERKKELSVLAWWGKEQGTNERKKEAWMDVESKDSGSHSFLDQ